MTSTIVNYRPQCKIIVNHSLEIDHQLGDTGGLQLTKNLYAPCGEFTLTFPDQPYHNGGTLFGPVISDRRSLYDMVNPLDPIEIQLKRWQDDSLTDKDWVTVLRGFVRSIGRDEAVGGDGRVERRIVIAGHDCGAVFLMEQLGAILSAAITGVPVPPGLAYIKEFQLSTNPTPLRTFIWDVAYNATQQIMKTAGWTFSNVTSVEKGYCLPTFAFSAEGALWELLRRYSDGPWNELFVREGDKAPELVFRPTPWKDTKGAFLTDAVPSSVKTWDIPMKDIVTLSAHRDDTEQVQHTFVMSTSVIMQQNWLPLLNGFGEFNTELRAKYGDRIQQVQSTSMPGIAPLSLPEKEQTQSFKDNYSYLLDRTKWMVSAGKDVYQFEKGSITIKGNPHIRVGDYVNVKRGVIEWAGYIVSVQHNYSAYRHYLTTIEYIRSDQWIQRQKVKSGVWDKERKQG